MLIGSKQSFTIYDCDSEVQSCDLELESTAELFTDFQIEAFPGVWVGSYRNLYDEDANRIAIQEKNGQVLLFNGWKTGWGAFFQDDAFTETDLKVEDVFTFYEKQIASEYIYNHTLEIDSTSFLLKHRNILPLKVQDMVSFETAQLGLETQVIFLLENDCICNFGSDEYVFRILDLPEFIRTWFFRPSHDGASQTLQPEQTQQELRSEQESPQEDPDRQ